jgi:transposase-like protein
MRKIVNHHQKAQITFEAIKGEKTLSELSSQYQIHASKIDEWQEILKKGAPAIFAQASKGSKEKQRIEQLQKIIGQRQEEIDWLKKKLPDFEP